MVNRDIVYLVAEAEVFLDLQPGQGLLKHLKHSGEAWKANIEKWNFNSEKKQ